ncbi:MAG: malonic semialdehyde reductase [Mesorhizobium sp.]
MPAPALDRLFFDARTPRAWQGRAVSREMVRDIYEAAKLGPTSMNSTPARFVFLTDSDGKERLRPALSPRNVDKAMSAPVIAIIGGDRDFVRFLPTLWPRDVQQLFADKPALREETARRNATLQGGYFIMAARAFGLDCAPMSGFDAAQVDAAFFAGSSIRTDFLCCMGYGDHSQLQPRLPRLTFEETCSWV